MCWTCNLKDFKPLVADEDIEVYKIVKHANEEFCVAVYQKYCYETKLVVDKHISVEIQSSYVNIRTGLHSYKSVTFIPDSIYIRKYGKLNVRWKSFYSGNNNCHSEPTNTTPVDNDLYLATFKIPKDTVYFENKQGEIVSRSIYYTGKYLKL